MMQFEAAAPELQNAVARVMRAAFDPYVRKLGRELTPTSYDWLANPLARGSIYIARDGADLVGAIATTPRGPELVIDMIAVEPTRQGSGIGSWLLARIEEVAWDAGFRCLSLDTAEMMGGLLRFYERHGYHEVRRGQPLHGKDPHTRVFFAKLLPDVATPV